MDGTNPRRYRPVRRPAVSSTQRSSALGNTVREAQYPDKLVFASGDLAPAPPAPAPADNLLLAAVKDRAITFTLPLFDNVELQDTIELVLNGVGLGPAKEIPLDPFILGGTDITVTLDPADHNLQPEGRVEINYVVHFRSFGTDFQPGPPGQFYATDYTKPGLPFLGQLVFSDEVMESGVTEDVLVPDGDDPYLPARVPGYTGLAAGDVITGIVGGQSETIDAISVTGGEIELRFKRSFIAQLDDGSLPFSYSVTDRAGNPSDPAEPVVLKVLLKGAIVDLVTPRIPAYDDDDDTGGVPKLVDEADARLAGGLLVEIPANANILAGDEVLVLWGAAEVGPVRIADPAADPLASIGVPYAAIADSWNAETGGTDTPQTLGVSYRILRNGLSAGEPAVPASVAVNLHQGGGEDPDPETPENENLSKPSLASATPGDANVIPPDDFDDPATITIPWLRVDGAGTTAAFIEGDDLLVRYGSTDLTARPITAQDVTDAKDIVVTLPPDIIASTGSGDAIPLQYFIVRKLASGGPNTSASPVQPIKVSGTDELPGGGTLPACKVPEAEGVLPEQPDRLIIGREQGTDGTDFVIPAYTNQDIADSITVHMAVFRSFYANGHPADTPANGGGARDLEILDIHPSSATSDTRVHVTEAQLMHYEIPTQALHGHITYTVAGVAGPDRPVTSAQLLLDIDPRGS